MALLNALVKCPGLQNPVASATSDMDFESSARSTLAAAMRWRSVSSPTVLPTSEANSLFSVERDTPSASASWERPKELDMLERMYSSALRTIGLDAAMMSVDARTVMPRGGTRIVRDGTSSPSMSLSRSSAPSYPVRPWSCSTDESGTGWLSHIRRSPPISKSRAWRSDRSRRP